MKRDQSFHDYVVHDLFSGIPGITSRAMFGGWGIYQHGVFFAIIIDGALYFKVDENNRSDFKKLGSKPFVYSKKDKKSITMSYWLLPEEIMEDGEKLSAWVRRSVEAGGRVKKNKKILPK